MARSQGRLPSWNLHSLDDEMVLRTVVGQVVERADETERRPIRKLLMPRTLMESILAHLQEALPNEGCGLIAGKTSADGVHTAQRFFAGENTDRSPTRFTMDGTQVIAAFKEMRAMGQDLGAIVHSHPTSPAEPSQTDLREAFYTDALAVIVSFQRGLPDTRAWTWCPERPDEPFQERTLEICTDD